MQLVIQITNNILVVDTGKNASLSILALVRNSAHPSAAFPARGEPAPGRNYARERGSGRDVARSSGPSASQKKSGALMFPKAQFVFVDAEWNYWTGSRYESEVNSSPMPDPFKKGTIGAAQENLPPVAGRSRFVKQGGEITTGVHYVAAPGHSPSHAAILFTSGNEQFMHMGDIAHNPVTSLQHPEWTPVFDYDPAQAIKSRKAILIASRPIVSGS